MLKTFVEYSNLEKIELQDISKSVKMSKLKKVDSWFF
jgi:hypothetical protein